MVFKFINVFINPTENKSQEFFKGFLFNSEAIEEFSREAMDWHFQCGQDLKGDELALDCSIQEIGEGVEEVEFAGLGRLKERDLLWVW